MSDTNRSAQTQTILNRSVVLILETHYLGNHRKVKTSAVVEAADGNADKVDGEQVKATKRLVDSKALLPAMRILKGIQLELRRRAIAANGVFGDRTYLIPLGVDGRNVEDVDAWLEAQKLQLSAVVDEIAAKYRDEQEKQKERLGPLYNAKDYTTPEEVKERFSFDWRYVSFDAPGKLESVSRVLFERTKAKFEASMADAYDEVRLVLRETLRQTVNEIAKKLKPAEDGRPKVFRDTILDDLTDFLGTFSVRNITDDAELTAIVERMKGLTHGVDPQDLRDVDKLRESVLEAATAATAQLDELITTAGRRGIRFGPMAAA